MTATTKARSRPNKSKIERKNKHVNIYMCIRSGNTGVYENIRAPSEQWKLYKQRRMIVVRTPSKKRSVRRGASGIGAYWKCLTCRSRLSCLKNAGDISGKGKTTLPTGVFFPYRVFIRSCEIYLSNKYRRVNRKRPSKI